MTSQLASMLDELMGKQRNLHPDEQKKDFTFEDEDVCKFFLVGFCPNEMFINTKSDLGNCTKMHDEKLKEAYQNSDKYEKLGYEEEFMAFLLKMHNDMDRKIKRHKERLTLTQQESGAAGPEDTQQGRLETKIDQLSEKMNEYLEQAESLGAEGKVEESLEATRVAERYKTEREMAKKALAQLTGAAEDIKPMEVCEICGCFLIVGDAQQRIDEHMTGKQHMGYAKIKATIEELQRRKEERKEKERLERDKEREKRKDQDKERDRSKRGERSREPERSKESSDRHRDRDRERDKDRDKDRDRERDRDRDRRDRGRDDRAKSRERSDRHRKRSRSRSRGDRDRKDKKSRRSRSRSRERSSRHSTSSRSHRDKDRGRDREKEKSSRDHHHHRDRKDRDKEKRRSGEGKEVASDPPAASTAESSENMDTVPGKDEQASSVEQQSNGEAAGDNQETKATDKSVDSEGIPNEEPPKEENPQTRPERRESGGSPDAPSRDLQNGDADKNQSEQASSASKESGEVDSALDTSVTE